MLSLCPPQNFLCICKHIHTYVHTNVCIFQYALSSVNTTMWASFLISIPRITSFCNDYTYGCAIFISPVPNNGHSGCFPCAAITNDAVVNTLFKDCLWLKHSVLTITLWGHSLRRNRHRKAWVLAAVPTASVSWRSPGSQAPRPCSSSRCYAACALNAERRVGGI